MLEELDYPHHKLTGRVIAAAVEVHREMGPGLLESVYQRALEFEMASRKIPFRSQAELPVQYKGNDLGSTLRLDFVIDDAVVLEIKSVSILEPIHTAQLLTYLRLSLLPVGLLINFNMPKVTDGVVRRVLIQTDLIDSSVTSAPSASPR